MQRVFGNPCAYFFNKKIIILGLSLEEEYLLVLLFF
jgi:hypothetical protein